MVIQAEVAAELNVLFSAVTTPVEVMLPEFIVPVKVEFPEPSIVNLSVFAVDNFILLEPTDVINISAFPETTVSDVALKLIKRKALLKLSNLPVSVPDILRLKEPKVALSAIN